MFKNIYVNNKTGKVVLWENINGKNVRIEDKIKKTIYVEDRTGKSKITDIYGTPMIKMDVTNKHHAVSAFKANNLKTCETDLSDDMLYLQDRYKNVDLKPDIKEYHIAFLDIEIAVENEFPYPDLVLYPVNLITVKSSKTGKCYTFGTNEFTKTDSEYVKHYAWIPNELEMLQKFVRWWRKQKFDIVTGWNSRDFDMKYIINRIKKLSNDKTEELLSPFNKIITKRHKVTNPKTKEVTVETSYIIPGLSQLDYLYLYKNFTFDTKSSYSLNNICMSEIQQGKLEFEGTINDIYKTDWNKFVEYNVLDVLLVETLDRKMKFLDLTITLCHQALIPFERILSSIAVLEGFILRYLHEHGMVMPDRKEIKDDWYLREGYYYNNGVYENTKVDDGETTFEPFYIKGGHVYAKPDFYKENISYDVESEYPHMIMLYNISPETKVIKPTAKQIKDENLIKSEINGVYYRRKKGIFPIIIEKILNERRDFKKAMFLCADKNDISGEQYYHSMQLIRKIIINSIYGVMGSKFFHFYDVDNARAVTRGGRVLIRFLGDKTNSFFKNHWHKKAYKFFPDVVNHVPLKKDVVVVLDTDSNYLNFEELKSIYAPDMNFLKFANYLDEKVLSVFFNHILDRFYESKGLKNIIRYKREGIILKQFVLAKKKYMTELLADEDKIYDPPKIKYKGVEVVRSDTPIFNRNHIKDVIQLIFDYLDKQKTITVLKAVKKEFNKSKVEDVSSNSGVKDYNKYAYPMEYYFNDGLQYKTRTPIHNRASINYNYLITKYNLHYVQVNNGTKIKYIYVNKKNFIEQDVIGYVGNYPKEFDRFFKIDYDTQFEKTFLSVIQRMFDVLKWGPVNLRGNILKQFIKR